MGFLSYYRSYIPDFSQPGKPLCELLAKTQLWAENLYVENGGSSSVCSATTIGPSSVDRNLPRNIKHDNKSADKTTCIGLAGQW